MQATNKRACRETNAIVRRRVPGRTFHEKSNSEKPALKQNALTRWKLAHAHAAAAM